MNVNNQELTDFLEETYRWFAKVFREQVKFDDDGRIYTIPIISGVKEEKKKE